MTHLYPHLTSLEVFVVGGGWSVADGNGLGRLRWVSGTRAPSPAASSGTSATWKTYPRSCMTAPAAATADADECSTAVMAWTP